MGIASLLLEVKRVYTMRDITVMISKNMQSCSGRGCKICHQHLKEDDFDKLITLDAMKVAEVLNCCPNNALLVGFPDKLTSDIQPIARA